MLNIRADVNGKKIGSLRIHNTGKTDPTDSNWFDYEVFLEGENIGTVSHDRRLNWFLLAKKAIDCALIKKGGTVDLNKYDIQSKIYNNQIVLTLDPKPERLLPDECRWDYRCQRSQYKEYIGYEKPTNHYRLDYEKELHEIIGKRFLINRDDAYCLACEILKHIDEYKVQRDIEYFCRHFTLNGVELATIECLEEFARSLIIWFRANHLRSMFSLTGDYQSMFWNIAEKIDKEITAEKYSNYMGLSDD